MDYLATDCSPTQQKSDWRIRVDEKNHKNNHRLPGHHRATYIQSINLTRMHTCGQLRVSNSPGMCFFNCGRKREKLERIFADTGRTCKLPHREATVPESNLQPSCWEAATLTTVRYLPHRCSASKKQAKTYWLLILRLCWCPTCDCLHLRAFAHRVAVTVMIRVSFSRKSTAGIAEGRQGGLQQGPCMRPWAAAHAYTWGTQEEQWC